MCVLWVSLAEQERNRFQSNKKSPTPLPPQTASSKGPKVPRHDESELRSSALKVPGAFLPGTPDQALLPGSVLLSTTLLSSPSLEGSSGEFRACSTVPLGRPAPSPPSPVGSFPLHFLVSHCPPTSQSSPLESPFSLQIRQTRKQLFDASVITLAISAGTKGF